MEKTEKRKLLGSGCLVMLVISGGHFIINAILFLASFSTGLGGQSGGEYIGLLLKFINPGLGLFLRENNTLSNENTIVLYVLWSAGLGVILGTIINVLTKVVNREK